MSEVEPLLVEFDGLYHGMYFRVIDKDAARGKMVQAKDLGSRYAKAWCLLEGWSIDKNEEAAAALFRELAEKGDIRGQEMLGVCLYFGRGVPKDEVEAVSWFMKLSHCIASYYLGVAYYNGRGVIEDRQKAVKYWREASQHGHTSAMYNLGTCLRNGQGVEQDFRQAAMWLRLASRNDEALCTGGLIGCLHDAAKALLDTGDRIESAELLWEAIEEIYGRLHGRHYLNSAISRDFWTKTLPPLRLIAARAAILAGESNGDELVRQSLAAAGLPYFARKRSDKCTIQ